MLYYDTNLKVCMNDTDLILAGIKTTDKDKLKQRGIYQLTIVQPDYDPATQGLEKDGEPTPDPDNPYGLILNMKLIDYLSEERNKKKEQVAAKRWEYEQAGIELNGLKIRTDAEAQNKMDIALLGMKESGLKKIDFKTDSGWKEFTLEEFSNIVSIVHVYIQKCFKYEHDLVDKINACKTLGELNALDLTLPK